MSEAYLFFLVPLCASLFFIFYCLVRVLQFERDHAVSQKPDDHPPVAILRPLHGADAETYGILATLPPQVRPPSRIRYGVDDPGDPSVGVVERLERDFPGTRMELVAGAARDLPNPKVANLSRLSDGVDEPIVLSIDQDIVTGPGYLEAILSPFSDPLTGMVTALYRIEGGGAIGTWLEILSVHGDFFPSVLAAEGMERGLRFAFGATMAVRREVLEKIGGLESLGEYLADDHELGLRVTRAGYRVALSGYIVEHRPGKVRFRDYWSRQIRAARTHRVCRPGGYALSLLTQGFPWLAGLFLATGCSIPFLVSLGVWGGARALLVLTSHRVLSKRQGSFAPLLLLPVHEMLRFAFWLLAFTGSRVEWGGRAYRVYANGKMAEEPGVLRKPGARPRGRGRIDSPDPE